MDRLRVAAGTDQRVVTQQRSNRVGEHVLDHLPPRRVRQHLCRRHLRRLERARSQRPDVLGRGVGRAGAGASQPADEGIENGSGLTVCVVSRTRFGNLDLDLAKSSGHPASVAHRHLVVYDLRQAVAGRVGEPDAAPNGRQPGDRYQRAAANESTNHGQGCGGWFLRPTCIRQLTALQHGACASNTGPWCELQRPAFAGAVTERDAPSCEAQIWRVVVDRLETEHLGCAGDGTVDHAPEVR